MSEFPDDKRLPGEATPEEAAGLGASTASGFGLHDSKWTEADWETLLKRLVEEGFASWKDVSSLVLGHLNPSQFGTSLASSEGFKDFYQKGNTMALAQEWARSQAGRCVDCGTRLELQADHVKSKQEFIDEGKSALEADRFPNMTLRCRRCNVVKRGSHVFGGQTHLTAEAALMWILLVIRPRTLKDYIRLCRVYGMTMSDIRMEEAWAMAHWLSKSDPPQYGIEDDENGVYDLLAWDDGAITRIPAGSAVPEQAQILAAGVPGSGSVGFIATSTEEPRPRFFQQEVAFIPFSTYDLGTLPRNALTISYRPPDRENAVRVPLQPLPPKGMKLLSFQVCKAGEKLSLNGSPLEEGKWFGALVKLSAYDKRKFAEGDLALQLTASHP